VKIFLAALFVLIGVVGARRANAVDWSSCQDDLDRLRRAARDAADAAEAANSRYRDLESASSWLRLCSGECSFERWRYQSARGDYESAKSTAEGELDTVSSRVSSVESSCEIALRGTGAKGPRSDRFCQLLQRYRQQLGDKQATRNSSAVSTTISAKAYQRTPD
jgi:hypothetical protein